MKVSALFVTVAQDTNLFACEIASRKRRGMDPVDPLLHKVHSQL